jgi:hypothetical protein
MRQHSVHNISTDRNLKCYTKTKNLNWTLNILTRFCFNQLFSIEKWFLIFVRDRNLFCFHSVSPEVKTSRNLFFPLPLYMYIGSALITPSPTRFPIVSMSPYPLLWGLKNFAWFLRVWTEQPLKLVSLVVHHFLEFFRPRFCLVQNFRIFFCFCRIIGSEGFHCPIVYNFPEYLLAKYLCSLYWICHWKNCI